MMPALPDPVGDYSQTSQLHRLEHSLLHWVEFTTLLYGQAKMTTLSKNKMKDDTLNVVSGERETEPSDCE